MLPGDWDPLRRPPVASGIDYCPRDGARFNPSGQCPTCGLSQGSVQVRASASAAAPERRWRKLLYVKQAFPDNYVDESTFLDELQQNGTLHDGDIPMLMPISPVNVRTYDYFTLVRLSASVTQHLSTLALFSALFLYTYEGYVSANALVAFGVVSAVVGYICWSLPHWPSFRTYKYLFLLLFLFFSSFFNANFLRQLVRR